MAAKELYSTPLFSDANLRAYYRLENLNDSTANGYNLSDGNSAQFVAGKFTNAARLGEDVNRVLYISSNLGSTGNTITFGGWFKLVSEIGSGTYCLASHWDNTTKTAKEINYEYNSGTRRLNFQRIKQGVGFENAYYTVTLGNTDWHHIVWKVDGTKIYGYLDGSEVTSANMSGNGSASTNDLSIIASTTSSNSGLAVSNMTPEIVDDFFVFNRVLTATEISNLYKWPSGSGFFNFF